MARSFDAVQLGSIELFCKAAELGSFTAAAGALGVTPASVSRSISRLEARLGVRLFARSTRSVRLTQAGELYQAQCQQALDQVEIELNVSNRNIDFIEDNYDLAIRLGDPRDSRLVARPLESASLGVFAAPDYLSRRGQPHSLCRVAPA